MSSSEPAAISPAPKKRLDSIDAFRGFTILAMIFVIRVAGFHDLPLTFPQFGSAPVSTFKHAGEDKDAAEWRAWMEKHPDVVYREGSVTAVHPGRRYDVQLAGPDARTSGPALAAVGVWHAKNLRPGEHVIGVSRDAGRSFSIQGTGIGCTFTDLVAPFFVFIVGVCIPLSRQGRGPDWWRHAGARTIMLIVAGVIYISLILKLSYWWGILQAIGISYFMGAACMRLPVLWRWVAVAAVAAAHGALTWMAPWWVELGTAGKPFLTVAALYDSAVLQNGDPLRPLTVHCTPWGSISYGLITMIGTLIGEALVTREHAKVLRSCLVIGIGCTAVGYLLHLYQAPMNKDFVSPSYSIFTSGIGALTFLAFYWVMDVWGIKAWARPLNVFGSNALLAYFLQPIVRIFFIALGLMPFFESRSAWSGVAWGLAWTAVLWAIVLYCNRRKIYWKL